MPLVPQSAHADWRTPGVSSQNVSGVKLAEALANASVSLFDPFVVFTARKWPKPCHAAGLCSDALDSALPPVSVGTTPATITAVDIWLQGSKHRPPAASPL